MAWVRRAISQDENSKWIETDTKTHQQRRIALEAEIMKAAKAEGISDRTLHPRPVSVTARRNGFPARSVWEIDPGQSGRR